MPGRFTPLWDDVIGYIKVFFAVWLIAFIITFIALRADKWAFWGGISIGFIVAVIGTIIIAIITGHNDPFKSFGKGNQ
jgi:hypothetical protein